LFGSTRKNSPPACQDFFYLPRFYLAGKEKVIAPSQLLLAQEFQPVALIPKRLFIR